MGLGGFTGGAKRGTRKAGLRKCQCTYEARSVQRAPNQGLGELGEFPGHRSRAAVTPGALAVPSAPKWVSGALRGSSLQGPAAEDARGAGGSEVTLPSPLPAAAGARASSASSAHAAILGAQRTARARGPAVPPGTPRYGPVPPGTLGCPPVPPARPAPQAGPACGGGAWARPAHSGGAVAKRRRPRHGPRCRRCPVRL